MRPDPIKWGFVNSCVLTVTAAVLLCGPWRRGWGLWGLLDELLVVVDSCNFMFYYNIHLFHSNGRTCQCAVNCIWSSVESRNKICIFKDPHILYDVKVCVCIFFPEGDFKHCSKPSNKLSECTFRFDPSPNFQVYKLSVQLSHECDILVLQK